MEEVLYFLKLKQNSFIKISTQSTMKSFSNKSILVLRESCFSHNSSKFTQKRDNLDELTTKIELTNFIYEFEKVSNRRY